MSKRAQNKERKKAQIIEAATWLILKHGHADFTMPELALFVESGLSPYQTLVAATTEPARYFDAEGEFGTIVEGASADMVMLDANPLDNIANASKISGVMLRGQWLSKDDIQAVQEQLQSEYAADRELLASIMPAQ